MQIRKRSEEGMGKDLCFASAANGITARCSITFCTLGNEIVLEEMSLVI